MIPIETQRELAEYYGGKRVKTAFDRSMVEGFQAEFLGDRESYSASIFVDVSEFSRKIQGRSAVQVRRFLDAYYSVAIPRIAEHGGMIDRIAGDGIVAVFSDVFVEGLDGTTADDLALRVAEQVVSELHGTEQAAKAAVSFGPLLFCKTGFARMFEEFTVIGNPLTELYRLEDQAGASEVVLRGDSACAQRVRAQVRRQKLERIAGVRPELEPPYWYVIHDDVPLRGVNNDQPVRIVRERWTT